MPSRPPPIFSLTSLRFFLAIWVVFYHEVEYWGPTTPWVNDVPSGVYNLLHTGYVAVGIFFVLSGFVLAYNYPLARKWAPEERKRFGIARFARIYPAYCAGLLLVLPFIAKGLYNQFTRANAVHQAFAALLSWTLLQSWFPNFAIAWNGPGWSLSNEAFFYCCFPFIGVLLWKLSKIHTVVAASILTWAAAMIVPAIVLLKGVPGFGDADATTVHIASHWMLQNIMRFNPLLQFPAFGLGILLARIHELLRHSNHWLVGRGYVLYLPGLLLEGLSIIGARHVPFLLFDTGLLLPWHGCIILGLALGGGFPARWLFVRPFVFLGDTSYAIYILHWPLQMWMVYATARLHSHLTTGVFIAIYSIAVVLISCAFFQWIEKPANRYLRAKLGSWVGKSKIPKTPQPVIA